MSFVDHQSNAEKWLTDNKSEFRLSSAEEKEGRLHFCIPNTSISFIVTCPSEKEPWGVCSEDERVLVRLQDVMEYLDSKNHLTIDSVLKLISDKLKNMTTASQSSDGRSSKGQEVGAYGGSDNEDDFEDADEGDDSEEDDAMDMGYYDDDPDVQEKEEPESKEDEDVDTNFFGAQGNPSSVQRLTKDLKNLIREGSKYGFTAEPRNNNLFRWDVQLRDIPEDSKLGKDLKVYADKCKKEPVIQMEMQFPGDYPFNPPFLRVVRPRFRFLTGHVTIGGSICMEMLTKSGWRPTNDIESILVQVRCEILSDPNASLDLSNPDRAYGEQEAREAFNRMVMRYGWNK